MSPGSLMSLRRLMSLKIRSLMSLICLKSLKSLMSLMMVVSLKRIMSLM